MSGDDNQCCNAKQCKSPELDLWPVLYIVKLVEMRLKHLLLRVYFSAARFMPAWDAYCRPPALLEQAFAQVGDWLHSNANPARVPYVNKRASCYLVLCAGFFSAYATT